MIRFMRFNPTTGIPYRIKTANGKVTTFNKANVTVAYERQENGSIVYGVSFCSPLDQFCRNTGREQSTEDLKTNVGMYNFIKDPHSLDFSMRDELKCLLQSWDACSDNYQGNLPNWFGTFVKNILLEDVADCFYSKYRIHHLYGIGYLSNGFSLS